MRGHDDNVGSCHGRVHEAVRNPFRKPLLRQQFDQAVSAYDACHRNLITPGGRRCRGNSWATQFWRGFDGLGENMWDAASTQSSGYIWWRAGREVGKALKKLEAEAVLKDEGDDRPFGP